jgi:TRAP transporter 4TM/12TM fusion protein
MIPEETAPVSTAPWPIRGIVVSGAALLVLVSLAHAADLYRAVGLQLFSEQVLFAMLGIAFLVLFLHLDVQRRPRTGYVPWYDWLLALAGFLSCAWLAVRYPRLADIVVDQPPEALVTGTLILVLTAEGLRRTVGPILLTFLLLFIAFGMAGQFVPGQLQGQRIELGELVTYLTFDTNSLVGIPMKVVTSIVVAFLLFGAVLFRSGGSAFFTDFSVALMGRTRGGSAKISIVASSLFGSISGSVVSNVVSTGVITIPMMRDGGYRPVQAAAIEATASTGGQLMPPVMGATAFVMAEYLYVPYSEVVLAALVPSFLYYVGLFIQADLEAGRQGIARVPRHLIPRLGVVLATGWVFTLPFGVLIYGLFWLNHLPEEAALNATLVLIAIGLLLGYKGQRMRLRQIFDAIAKTGVLVLDLVMIGAAAGLIIGIINKSGLGFALTLMLVKVGTGSLPLLLLLCAGVSILLGMGMPTIGVYVLVATLIAPAMIELGVQPMAAHMFVLYFGMLSFITPPLCIAAFAAANIARADPLMTGVVATRFGWSAFVVPFLFVASPSLLLYGSPFEIAHDVLTAVGGVLLVSVALVGYTTHLIGGWERGLFLLSGIALLIPAGSMPAGNLVDLAGLAVAVVLVSRHAVRRRLERARAVRGG